MKHTISTTHVVTQSQHIVSSNIDDEKVMMDVEKGNYFGLDPVGRSIWDILETPMRVDELIARLLTSYDVDQKTCETDVIEFLEKLYEDGMVDVSDKLAC